MPLDLHVLSLSLAFILSQDQTLHSKIKFWISAIFACIFRSVIYPFEFLLGTHTCCLLLSPFQYFKELICLVRSPRFWGESGCKDKNFIHSNPNLFASFFKLFSRTAVSIRLGLCQACFTSRHQLFPVEKAGANLRVFSWISKSSKEFFEKFMDLPVCMPEKELFWTILNAEYQSVTRLYLHHSFNPLFLIAGAKINQYHRLFQIFLRIFFDYFQTI